MLEERGAPVRHRQHLVSNGVSEGSRERGEGALGALEARIARWEMIFGAAFSIRLQCKGPYLL